MGGEDGSSRAGRPPRPPDPPEDGDTGPELRPNAPTQAAPDEESNAWSASGAARLRDQLIEPAGAADYASPELRRLYAIATADYPLHEGTALWPMMPDELAALEAYVDRRLDLPGPPTFLTCTVPALKRSAMMAYHHDQVEGTLIADVPARVRLGKHLPRRSLLRELVEANTKNDAGKERMKLFIKAAQRIVFDGRHTLTFVFMSRRAAERWAGTALTLRGCALTLNWADDAAPGTLSPPQVARHYAVRILGTEGLNAVSLLHVFSQIAGEPVLDIRHPGVRGLGEPDNDYWTVIFATYDCPNLLMGVTSVVLGDQTLLLHHFQRNSTAPCRSCYNPAHVSARCSVNKARLDSTRASRQRRYVGDTGGVDRIRFDRCASVALLDSKLTEVLAPLSMVMPTEGRLVLEPMVAPAPTASREDPGSQAEGRPSTQSDATGWTIVRRPQRTAREHSVESASADGPPRREAHVGQAPSPRTPNGGIAATVRAESNSERLHCAQGRPKPTGRKTTTSRTEKPPRSAAAAQDRPRRGGSIYDELAADSDSDDEITIPASAQLAGATPKPAPVSRMTVPANAGRSSGSHPPSCPGEADADTDVEMVKTEDLSAPPALPSGANGACQAEPGVSFSLADIHSPSSETQPSQEPFWHPASPVSSDAMEVEDIVPESPSVAGSQVGSDTSSDGFEMGETIASTTVALSVSEWVGSLHGAQVNVPANGQCLFYAYYASSTNVVGDRFKPTPVQIQNVNTIKRQVTDIVMANMRYDVQLKLFDPIEELARMYPSVPAPSTAAGATAALYAHYAGTRNTSVAQHVPRDFWGGTQILRALAVLVREPVYVWDVAPDGTAHVQQYLFQTFTMPNGDKHETGVVQALPDNRIRDILEACFHHHVIPLMLVLNHTEGHFYGVQHGQTFLDWHAQPGPEMRARLDAVHAQVGLPILDGTPYEPDSFEAVAVAEEAAILEEVGHDVYASGPRRATSLLSQQHLKSSVPPRQTNRTPTSTRGCLEHRT